MTLFPSVLFQWFVVSLPLVIFISEIMFANNIADYAEDEENKRHTLVHYLGITLAKRLYIMWVVLAFIILMVATVINWLPITSYALIVLLPILLKNARDFVNHPIKEETFILAIKNLVILMLGMTVVVLVGIGL